MSTADDSRSRLMRTRWAAIGAAVAVTIGAGGLYTVGATSASSSFVAISPVRVLDSRTDVGLAGPFTSDVARKLDVTWTDESSVPEGATAIVANVTVVSPSTLGFVAVRPGDATGLPSTSSLNFAAGDVVPNSVTVELPTTGEHAGQIDLVFHGTESSATAHLLVDIVGYYQPAATGAPGPQGPAGPRGVSAWDVIPSGQTVTGEVVWNDPDNRAPNSSLVLVNLPARASTALSDEALRFDELDDISGDESECTGAPDRPTAPPGRVCIYMVGQNGILSVDALPAALADQGFLLDIVPHGADVVPSWHATWAYTAP